jgi:hypothetical protein
MLLVGVVVVMVMLFIHHRAQPRPIQVLKIALLPTSIALLALIQEWIIPIPSYRPRRIHHTVQLRKKRRKISGVMLDQMFHSMTVTEIMLICLPTLIPTLD